MKYFLVLLCMLVAKQWFSCEASRTILLERKEAGGHVGLVPVSKKMLSEAVDEANGMETEFMLPDESDDEVIIHQEEKKRAKQQKDLLMEALEEKVFAEEKQKDQEDESRLSETGNGELLLQDREEEKRVEEKPKKKRKFDKKEVSTENDSFGLLAGEKLQENGQKRVKAKKENIVMDEKVSGQPTGEDTPANADKGVEIEGSSGEAFLAEMEMETGAGDIPSETKEEQDGSTTVKQEMQEEDVKSKKRTKRVEVEGTSKAEKVEKEGFKIKTLDDDASKPKKDKAEGGKKGKKEGVFEGSKSKSLDDKDLKGEAMDEEITDDETPADLIEREMQGGMESLVTSASEESKGREKKQQKKDKVRTPKSLDATKTEGGEHKVKPLKKAKKPKSEVLEEDANKSEGGEDIKTPLKKAKMPQLENLEEDANKSGGGEDKEKPLIKVETLKSAVLEEADFELKEFDDIDVKGAKTKVKKSKESQSQLENGSDVISAGETSDLSSKQVDMEDAPKSPMKKKKKTKFDKLMEEEKFYDKNFDVSEKEEDLFEKAKEKSFKKSTKAKTFKKVEKKQKDTEDPKIMEVIDRKNAKVVKDVNEGKGDAAERGLKGSEEELPTIEKQQEKLELEVQGIAKEAQEKSEGLNSRPKVVSASSQGVDEEDDEYSDFMQDFSDLSTKFQDTAVKVADHLGPNIQKLTDTSKNYFNKANQQITESFSPLVGKQFAPFFASLLSYGLLLIPLAVVIVLFEHIRAMLSLQKVILFVNIYLAAYFATLLLATFIMGEPMNFFYRSSASGYVHLQLLQALGYIVYLILQTIDMVASCSSEACSIKVTVVLQWFVAVTIGFHYYVTIFHRAMALKGPHTNWKIYGIYSSAFLVLCLFARIKRVKKGYVQVGQVDTDKKH